MREGLDEANRVELTEKIYACEQTLRGSYTALSSLPTIARFQKMKSIGWPCGERLVSDDGLSPHELSDVRTERKLKPGYLHSSGCGCAGAIRR